MCIDREERAESREGWGKTLPPPAATAPMIGLDKQAAPAARCRGYLIREQEHDIAVDNCKRGEGGVIEIAAFPTQKNRR